MHIDIVQASLWLTFLFSWSTISFVAVHAVGMVAEMIYHLGVHQCAQLGETVAIALLVIISE